MSNTCIHSIRITTDYPFITKNGKGLAFYDILFTIIGAALIVYIMYKKIDIYKVLYVITILYILGVILHLKFEIKTPITNWISDMHSRM